LMDVRRERRVRPGERYGDSRSLDFRGPYVRGA
jgi:hypothetical protein